jgi:hypothetical protein
MTCVDAGGGRTVSDLRERYGTLRCATVLRGISGVPATCSATYTPRPVTTSTRSSLATTRTALRAVSRARAELAHQLSLGRHARPGGMAPDSMRSRRMAAIC